MWTIDPSINHADLAEFASSLAQHNFFQPDQDIVLARAPGRLDLMGGIADYSGALVLQMPLACAALAAVQHDPQPLLTVRSTAADIGGDQEVCIGLEALVPDAKVLDYAAAQAFFEHNSDQHWAAYVLGALIVLAHERQLPLQHGLRLLLHSSVPAGKGVSSSAAIEVASMLAIAGLYGIELEGSELARLCQMVENRVVGAPCGIMDQMTSACGEANHLLALLCQPAEIQGHVALPDDLEVWGIDSGIRHAVGGSDYASVRVAAFMGYRILADLQAMPSQLLRPALLQIEDSQWHGYLANIPPSLWEMQLREQTPVSITGHEFLERYTAFTDSVTTIDPKCSYAVRVATAHPIYEHQRVLIFRALLESASLSSQSVTIHRDQMYRIMGELMYQSHASYSACGLGSQGTDRLVELVRQHGADQGLYGAKITGGGSGGTVAILAQKGSAGLIQNIAEQYRQHTAHEPLLLSGSSAGAIRTGILKGSAT